MGGDHVVSYGQNYLIDLALSLKWKKLINELKSFSKNQKISFFYVLKTQVFFPLIPANLKKLFKIFFSNKFSQEPKSIDYKPDFIENIIKKYGFNLKHLKTNKNSMKSKEFHFELIQQIMNLENTMEMLDHGTASYLIEPRYPYLDKRLVEFCYGIPTEMKFKSGWKRYIQRVAMEEILPPEIQWRTRKGVILEVLQRNLFLFEKNEDKFIDNIQLKEYVNLDIIKDIYNKYKLGYQYNTYILWKILLLSQWLDKYKSKTTE